MTLRSSDGKAPRVARLELQRETLQELTEREAEIVAGGKKPPRNPTGNSCIKKHPLRHATGPAALPVEGDEVRGVGNLLHEAPVVFRLANPFRTRGEVLRRDAHALRPAGPMLPHKLARHFPWNVEDEREPG